MSIIISELLCLLILEVITFLIGNDIDQIQRELRRLRINQQPAGVSTTAQWVGQLREDHQLEGNVPGLQSFLESRAVSWWPTAEVPVFPTPSATETITCQPFVTARIDEIMRCGGRVHSKKKGMRWPGTSYYSRSDLQVVWHSQPVDGHAVVSFSNRKPDITCYNGDRRGGCSITLLGDVKGCAPRNRGFRDDEVGQVLSMGRDLMTKEQFTRTCLYCFLTDGFRFQFFRCYKAQQGGAINYEISAVYGGEKGWQVFLAIYCNLILGRKLYVCM